MDQTNARRLAVGSAVLDLRQRVRWPLSGQRTDSLIMENGCLMFKARADDESDED